MRLTIFHQQEPEELWKNSLFKIINQSNFQELKNKANIHLAIFNDGTCGLSATIKNEIVFFEIRDITRRRGVGKYLMEKTIEYLVNTNEPKTPIIINLNIFPSKEKEIAKLFLFAQGFEQNTTDDILVFNAQNKS